jgi:hypothetical protein
MLDIYEQGGTDAEVRVALAIPPARAMSPFLWQELVDRHPEFLEAVKEGTELARAWWMQTGRGSLFVPEGVKFNSVLYIFHVKNRFHEFREEKQLPPKDVTPTGEEGQVTIYKAALPDNDRG